MNRSEARAGSRVHVVYLEQGFRPPFPHNPTSVGNRSPTGFGTLVAPAPTYPVTDEPPLWYVRYNNLQIALHSINELERSTGTLLTDRVRTPEQWEARRRDEEDERATARREREELLRQNEEDQRQREEAQVERRRQEEAEEEDEMSREIGIHETRIEGLQIRLAEAVARLEAFRENRRRRLPVPTPPPAPKPPEEPGERFLDI